ASLGLESAGTVDPSANPPDRSIVVGSSVFGLAGTTLLKSLNDGTGVDVSRTVGANRSDFKITIRANPSDPFTEVDINIGPEYDADGTETAAAPTTIDGVLKRVNDALAGAGFASTASVDPATNAIRIASSGGETFSVLEGSGTSARDLGLLAVRGGRETGEAVIGGINTTLLRSLGGGVARATPAATDAVDTGVFGDGTLNFTLRDGTSTFTADISSETTVRGAINAINQAATDAGAALTARVNGAGTGIELVDASGGASNLIVTGTTGQDTAAALGLSTGAAGVAQNNISASSQKRYVSEGMRLDDLNGGRGIGSGTIRITDADGVGREVTIGDNLNTMRDLLTALEVDADLSASINSTGDGFVLRSSTGSAPIKIEDVSGTLARDLGLAGDATGTGSDNFLEARFETTVTFDADDTLDEAVQKINDAGAGVRVSVLDDGGAQRPFRMSFVAENAGRGGRTTIDAAGIDLGLDVLDEGDDARAFVGGNDEAAALLVTNDSNQLDGVILGLDVDLKKPTEGFEQLNVARDNAALETEVSEFIDAYNNLLDRIAQQTRFVEDTGERGALLGDGTVISLQTELNNAVNAPNRGFSGSFDRLAQVGVRVGSGNRLELDASRFREALAQDPESVEALFTTRIPNATDDTILAGPDGTPIATSRNPTGLPTYGELGVIGIIEQIGVRYTDSIEGVLTRRNETLGSQIDLQNDRIDQLNVNLENQRFKLEQEFIAMEQALAQLQNQQSALSSIG
ncbi:MAG: flagellar filament capping protein FliD, partial [Planctomycetota bacterium]